eukprot:6058219-Pleurochrysis_carterae.AAC.2
MRPPGRRGLLQSMRVCACSRALRVFWVANGSGCEAACHSCTRLARDLTVQLRELAVFPGSEASLWFAR